MKVNSTSSILVIILSSITFFGNSQIQNQTDRYQLNLDLNHQEPTMRDRYKVEFELVNEDLLGDSTILEQINYLTIDHFRKESEDFLFQYRDPAVEILIYSHERMRKKSNSLNITE